MPLIGDRTTNRSKRAPDVARGHLYPDKLHGKTDGSAMIPCHRRSGVRLEEDTVLRIHN